MYCKNCGANISEGQQRCMNCGQPVDQGFDQTSGQTYNQMGNGQQYNQQYNQSYAQGYNQGGYGQPTGPIKFRNIAMCIIFTIISCGFYGLYWFVQLTEDVNTLSGDHKTSGGIALLLNIVTCGLYGIYWAYKQGEKLDYIKQSRGIASANSGILYLVLQALSLSIIGMALMQNEVNKFATTK